MADDDDGEPIEGLSFWEPGGYKKTTKRITDGNQLCTEIVDMVQERCEIEAAYASKLKSWSKRWIAQIDKGPEYGSMESAWKAVLTAADREADVHLRVKENLVSTIQNEMRRWQKENFHKGMMALHLKEKKEMDEEFRKAQKPWKKRFLAVEKSKKEYHDLCQKEQSVVQRSKMYQNDTGISEDQKAKTLDEIAKLNTQRQSARGNYEDALRDLNSYNARYMEDMKEVYARCQEMEHKRLDFFKDRLKAMHQNLDLSNDVVVKQIAADFLNTVEQANAKSDLKYWDAQRGIEMPMYWPQFEEWAPRIAPITGNGGLFQRNTPNITSGTIRRLNEDAPPTTVSPVQTIRSTTVTTTTISAARPGSGMNNRGDSTGVVQRPIAASRESLNRHSSSRESLQTPNKSPFDSDEERGGGSGGGRDSKVYEEIKPVATVRTTTVVATESDKKSFDNPFNEPDWSSSSARGQQDDRSKSGVRVKALYAYGGEEADELTFKEGDIFEKIEERDEQGWCKGRKDGRVGLFPADYVEPV